MIATVMLTAILASLCFVLAAHCAERGLHALRLPTRGPWLVASIASVAVPLGQLLAFVVDASAATAGRSAGQTLSLTTVLTVGVVERFSATTVASLDKWLIALWPCATLVISVRLLTAGRALERLAQTWKYGEVAGTPAWISQSFGPAVLGLSDAEIVIPARIADLPLDEQRLAVAHELEHIAAHDQRLDRIAALTVALVPWNPLAWLATRRLRSAIEIDCDARVLRKGPNVTAYTSLVLKVAGWPRHSHAAALALSESRIAQLERRLRLMTTKSDSRRLAPALLFFAATLALAAYGCEVTVNDVKLPSERDMLTSTNEVPKLPSVVTTASSSDKPYFEFQLDKPVVQAPGSPAPWYPSTLRQAGVEGEVLVQFVVDTEGRADVATFKVLKSSHELFAQSVSAALPAMRYIPAELGGKRVKQLVQQPFAYAIAR